MDSLTDTGFLFALSPIILSIGTFIYSILIPTPRDSYEIFKDNITRKLRRLSHIDEESIQENIEDLKDCIDSLKTTQLEKDTMQKLEKDFWNQLQKVHDKDELTNICNNFKLKLFQGDKHTTSKEKINENEGDKIQELESMVLECDKNCGERHRDHQELKNRVNNLELALNVIKERLNKIEDKINNENESFSTFVNNVISNDTKLDSVINTLKQYKDSSDDETLNRALKLINDNFQNILSK